MVNQEFSISPSQFVDSVEQKAKDDNDSQQQDAAGEILGNEDADDSMVADSSDSADPVGDSQEAEGAAEGEADSGPAAPPPPHHAQRRPPKKERVKSLPKPTAPTLCQRAAHELCHLPFESWCRHCVMARAQNMPHRTLKKHDAENVVPVVSADFAFMKQEDQDKSDPILVARDHKTRVSFPPSAREVDAEGGLLHLRHQRFAPGH